MPTGTNIGHFQLNCGSPDFGSIRSGIKLIFKNHFDYIHFNPVKHGYVEQVKNWPYSSFHYFVKAGMYSENWGGDIKPISMPDAGERFNNDCR